MRSIIYRWGFKGTPLAYWEALEVSQEAGINIIFAGDDAGPPRPPPVHYTDVVQLVRWIKDKRQANETLNPHTPDAPRVLKHPITEKDLDEALNKGHLTPDVFDKVKRVLIKYLHAMAEDAADLGQTGLVEHSIDTGTSPPIWRGCWHQPPEIQQSKIQEAKNQMRQFNQLLTT